MNLRDLLFSRVLGGSGGGSGGGVVVCEEETVDKSVSIDKLRGLSVSFPNATSIGIKAFYYCDGLTSVDFPVATSIGDSAFHSCNGLTSVDLPAATSIGDSAFHSCTNLTTIILRKTDVICNFNLAAILKTKIATVDGAPTGEGFIYVPAALLEDYVANFVLQITFGFGLDEATAEYMARAVLRKIEDYPEICG